MSLALAAQHLAARGRNGDSTLVHMTPSEVAGLQALAHAHGKTLTINPETGLPEAFSLKSLLPTLGGAALSMIPGVGPLMAAGIMGGGTALATGSLQKGLLAGLGAYGGAGLGGALAGAGASAANTAATNSILGANPGLTASEIGREMGTPGFVQPELAANANPATMSMTDKMTAGFKGLGTEAGRSAFMDQLGGAKGLLKYGAMAAAPVMMDQSGQAGRPPSSGPNPYEYDFNPGYTGPVAAPGGGTRYFDPRYTRRMADGGSTGNFNTSDDYYRYLMGLAPLPRVYTPTVATSAAPAAASPAQVSLTPYQQAVARMTPAELAAHNDYLANSTIERISGPAGLDPTEANQQAQQNMLDPVTGQPNAIVNALVPLANMLGITSPQQGAQQGLLGLASGNPLAMIGLAALGNAAQSAQQANISSISESSGNQVGPALGGTSVQEGMLSGLDTLPDSGVEVGGPMGTGMPVGTDIGPAATSVGPDSTAGTPGDDGVGWAKGGLSSLAAFAQGGYNLGDYSDGGRLLKGPGDGVSDSIPASIADKRPARLADGEFVVPARIVSELGNGSTDAGARKLYAMMDRIQNARQKSVGKGKVAVNSRAEKLLPA